MGATTTGQTTVAHVTLVRGPNSTGLSWVGLESVDASIAEGASTTTGGHIVFLDRTREVDIEVNGPNTIRVHNDSIVARSGVVTLIW
jgi:hypothetical protein